MKQGSKLFLTGALGVAFARAALADPTAFELVKKGDDYVGVQSKDKIVEIASDKSVAGLTPNVWHVVYYDPDTPFKSVEVKFGGGQEMGVSHPMHPMHPFEMPDRAAEILDLSKCRINSDQALNIATTQSLLRPLALRVTKLTLTHDDLGAVWKVQIWAAKMRNPDRDADVGTVVLSAADGSIVKLDLHPGRAE